MTKQEVINKLEQEITRAAQTNSFHSLDKVDTNLLSAALYYLQLQEIQNYYQSYKKEKKGNDL